MRVEGGQYLGDISALCYLHVPPHLSPLPFLVAGTGSQLLLIDVTTGKQIKSFRIFNGVRVHGIVAKRDSHSPSSLTFTIVVSGERTLKLFNLRLSIDSQSVSADLTLLHLLPRFTHWVLDFCFLKDWYLAVGCSDNSVHIWDVSTSTPIAQVRCPERCLLYSMRLWGHNLECLRIAAGTIFNEIVVWKLDEQCTRSLTSTEDDSDVTNNRDAIHLLECQSFEAHIISRLAGHQGSIFCLMWSSDGSKLVSVSDDRSARMWITDTEANSSDSSQKVGGPYLAGPVLFGHNARIWDCCFTDSLIVTAGEDCTCRVWGLDGKEVRVIKEHTGRGIWRCLYDPHSSLLVTAGFDSSIKAHCLHAPSYGFSGESIGQYERKAEVLKACIPNLSGHTGLMDSKSEYVRCLKFAREDTIYVATNHGYVYHAKLSESGTVEWTKLVRVAAEVPIICMDLLSRNRLELPFELEDWVAVGDGKGIMKVIKVLFNDGTPKVDFTISWAAEMERQLLGAYCCKSLGCGFIFTSNPKGMVKLWKWSEPSSHDTISNCDVYLVAEFVSPFGARVMCLDASCEEEVLICGDLRGNLVLFPLSKSILVDTSPQYIERTPSVTHFKGAHGISTVSSISIARFDLRFVEICSTGADGCICYLEYDRGQQTLEFVGMKQVKELSLIESISANHCSLDDSENSSYAVGFSSTDFLIWNLLTETKLLEVKCGGWRRPHSFHLGNKPNISSSFAYVKDEIIYVNRYRVPDGGRDIFPHNLHLQFHGREIHTLCIIPEEFKSAANIMRPLNHKISWIATGCEDGTVRLTRYSPGAENWSTSSLLGEHVGGSAVRSLCFVSKTYSAHSKVVNATNGTCNGSSYFENIENPALLISVGAKRVLTSWLLRTRQMAEEGALTNGLQNSYVGLNSSSRDTSSMSFKWLSTDMPVKCVRTTKKTQGRLISGSASDEVNGAQSVLTSDMELKQHGDAPDNDWRYLAVTAFLVSGAEARLTVCFVIVACSDATLTLRALVLPYRYWFDVSCLAPLSSPVLALQHVVIPLHLPYQGNIKIKNTYIVISGSTDGSIAFWDLSESVEAFMQRVSSLHIEKSIDFQKRPRTGRGSQGGRRWRSIHSALSAKRGSEASMPLNGEIISSDIKIIDVSASSVTSKDSKVSADAVQTTAFGSAECSDDSPSKISEIRPLHVLINAHQSGVNCLHVCCQNLGNSFQCSIISGGDDQALNFSQFVLLPSPMQSNLENIREQIDMISETGSVDYPNISYSIKFICQTKEVAAHSSAVKGVWSDGIWVFSTGLDHRVRCWNLQEHGSLTERGHFITSVPEPEALDVTACGRNCYQVVVAGRGMQMVEFFTDNFHEEDRSN